MDEGKIKQGIFRDSHTIAVVGLSPDPQRPSYHVASYLLSQGYDIIPVNPAVSQVLSRKAYPDLVSIPRRVDVVDVFRRPEETIQIAEEAVQIGARVLWLQEGIVNHEAASIARQAGLMVVMNRCFGKEHARFSMQLSLSV